METDPRRPVRSGGSDSEDQEKDTDTPPSYPRNMESRHGFVT